MKYLNLLPVSRMGSMIAAVLLLSFGANKAKAQVAFTEWVHPPDITLYATSPTTAGIGSSAAIVLDDAYSDTINLGFTFNFYGNTYTQCVIGANGTVNFDLALANQYDPWPISAGLLGNSAKYNSICGPWADMNIVYGGQITYFTTGTAPNRKFVVSYCHDAMYSCISQYTTTQIILFEGTDVAEVHIGHKDTCTGWNTAAAIVGVQNIDGTAATVAPGRDFPTVWLANNEAWQFVPDASYSSYSVNSITFNPEPYYTIYWFDTVTHTLLGTGDSLVVLGGTPGTYFAAAMVCSDTGATGLDTAATGYLRISSLNVNQVSNIRSLNIYPDPVRTTLNVDADDLINSVTVSNLMGRVMIAEHPKDRKARLDVSQLPSGIYLLNINNGTIRRFIKD
jgi:hypothetical protein